MTSTRSNTTLVVVAAFLGGCLTTQLAHTPTARAAETKFNGPTWDYKKVVILSEEEAKELGARGWELSACTSGACYFKRPL